MIPIRGYACIGSLSMLGAVLIQEMARSWMLCPCQNRWSALSNGPGSFHPVKQPRHRSGSCRRQGFTGQADAGIIGSKECVSQGFELFRNIIRPKRERRPHRIQGLDSIYFMKRLGP
ncbi:MAG: hypothetical protein U5L00_08590 [Desulfovermiculus sp.]|nr:hypothetical protein [Desulfovermiculus sp.]